MNNIIADYDKMVILKSVVKDWNMGTAGITSSESLDRVRSIVCPRPKPTADDIAWAEKRVEELEVENAH